MVYVRHIGPDVHWPANDWPKMPSRQKPPSIEIETLIFSVIRTSPINRTRNFPEAQEKFAVKAIGDGGKWVAVHSNTAQL